jgi:hypothetical protein
MHLEQFLPICDMFDEWKLDICELNIRVYLEGRTAAQEAPIVSTDCQQNFVV